MGDFYNIKQLSLLEKGLDMRVARQNIIHSNIANEATPGYIAKKAEFEAQLEAALGKKVGMKETHPAHFPNHLKGVAGVKPEITASADMPRLDGNNVNLDRELTENELNGAAYDTIIAGGIKNLDILFSAFQEPGRR